MLGAAERVNRPDLFDSSVPGNTGSKDRSAVWRPDRLPNGFPGTGRTTYRTVSDRNHRHDHVCIGECDRCNPVSLRRPSQKPEDFFRTGEHSAVRTVSVNDDDLLFFFRTVAVAGVGEMFAVRRNRQSEPSNIARDRSRRAAQSSNAKYPDAHSGLSIQFTKEIDEIAIGRKLGRSNDFRCALKNYDVATSRGLKQPQFALTVFAIHVGDVASIG